MSRKITRRDAAEIVWAFVRGELLRAAGGDAACMRRSEASWCAGSAFGGEIWEAVALGRSWRSLLDNIIERGCDGDE